MDGERKGEIDGGNDGWVEGGRDGGKLKLVPGPRKHILSYLDWE